MIRGAEISLRWISRVRSMAVKETSTVRCGFSTNSDDNGNDKESEAEKLQKLFASESSSLKVKLRPNKPPKRQHTQTDNFVDFFSKSDTKSAGTKRPMSVSDIMPKPRGREFVRNLVAKEKEKSRKPEVTPSDKLAETPTEVLGEEMVKATKAAAAALKGEAAANEVSMLKKLLDFEAETFIAAQTAPTSDKPISFAKLMETIKVGQKNLKEPKRQGKVERNIIEEDKLIAQAHLEMDRKMGMFKEPTRSPVDRSWSRRESQERLYNLAAGERLNIFQPEQMKSSEENTNRSETFAQLQQEELRRYYSMEPRNGFEEMIQWTEEGKLWPYPVDNEYQSEEAHIGFHEHVFLDHLIEEGFPKKGPIRQFMELVINGMSKNPYMTVKQKHAHVDWFREFFKERGAEIDKLHLLETGGAQIAAPAQ